MQLKPNDAQKGALAAAGALALTVVFFLGAGALGIAAKPAPVVAWHAFAALLSAGAAVAVFRRSAELHGPATLVAWHAAFWASLFAWRGQTAMWLPTAAGVLAALALGSSRAAFPGLDAPLAPSAAPKPAGTGPWLKENAESLVVALVTAYIIQAFCVKVFVIPSSSMEPTLVGNRQANDRIIVTKFYHALSDVERYDVVVFVSPLNRMRNLIKRVVGMPDEDFFIDRGNIFVRPHSEPDGRFRVARKPMRVQQSLWIRDREFDLPADRSAFLERWDVENGRRADFRLDHGRLTTRPRGDSRDFVFRSRSRPYQSEHPVDDISVSFDLTLHDPAGAFSVEISNEFGRFTLVLSPDQASTLEWRSARVQTQPLRTAKLVPGRRARVQLMVYDGLAVAMLDGEVEAEIAFLNLHDEMGDPVPAGGVTFDARGVLFSIDDFELARDVHYADAPMTRREPLPIAPDHYVMMGDNVANSYDSRRWTEAKLKLHDGRVIRYEGSECKTGPASADIYIEADENGYPHHLKSSEIESWLPARAHPTVHRKYLVGKALCVWWPPGRWFRFIR